MFRDNVVLSSPSGRIQLIPPTAAEDEAVAKLRSHPETRRFILFFPEHTSTEYAKRLRETRQNDVDAITFSVVLSKTDGTKDTFVGGTRIFNIEEVNGSCSLGILISPEYFRGGFGTETLYTVMHYVFEGLGLHRATFETAVDNVRMRGWLEKFGIKHEFTWREAWTAGEGKWTDVVGYSVLAGEWHGEVKAKLEAKVGSYASHPQ